MVKILGNKSTFNNVPLFDYFPAIEIRNANIIIETNFGQKPFEYEYKECVENDEKQWRKRKLEYE